MKKILSALFLALVSNAQASGEANYYPETFVQKFSAGSVKDDALKTEINTLLNSTHQKNTAGGRDTLGCDSSAQGCYQQLVLGYSGARKVLFGVIALQNNNGQYSIKDVYCEKIFTGNDIMPFTIPNSNKLNCEHTWPQSKFTGQYPTEMQKSDLNHLFASDSRANSIRGNYDFADIASDNGQLAQSECTASKSGVSAAGGADDLFEPPTEHKGNVARALFYFSVRYKMKIPMSEESVLRRWNDLDPVDDAERARNELVYKYQNNRNPFIDFPQLATYINKF
ncbi:MAG: endonuclease [Bacteriovorax sp.]|nr:endonuclease [Bacteriovorax sp.]